MDSIRVYNVFIFYCGAVKIRGKIPQQKQKKNKQKTKINTSIKQQIYSNVVELTL